MDSGSNKAYDIRISGIVQGVGYRPFVYKAAIENKLNGYVANLGGEVLIHVEGSEHHLKVFAEYIKQNYPEAASINSINVASVPSEGLADFNIIQSIPGQDISITVPPDISICENCINDIRDKSSRFFQYPFTSCTNCGPRFTIISEIPYDRENTSMNEFEMCEECRREYESPENRRHHAQTICCPKCGPALMGQGDRFLVPSNRDEEPVPLSCIIKQGTIIALKGIGGYHIICDAHNEEAVKRLRLRKKREKKPFAVMFKNIESLAKYCLVNENEKRLIQSREKPIVILRQKESSSISKSINPGLNKIGAMLPYSGIHYLMFDDEIDAVVATSGNMSNEPLIIDDDEAKEKLNQIADYFVTHNRKILSRCDDSVMFYAKDGSHFVRRSRGFAPAPISINAGDTKNTKVLAFGADLKNTFAVSKDRTVYMSQHIGNIESIESINTYKAEIESYMKKFNIKPEIAVCDMHPDYYSSRLARKFGLKVFEVQHHYAHIASVLAENGIAGEVIGVALDGTGYGNDGTVWGGEFFKASLKGFDRIGHFRQVPLPGGEAAAKEPWRMAGIYLYDAIGGKHMDIGIPCIHELEKNNWNTLIKYTAAGTNSPISSSAGRLFDAVSAILGICYYNLYEGQAAAELEVIADKDEENIYEYEIIEKSDLEIDFRKTIRSIVDELKQGSNIAKMSAKFHNTVVSSILDMCRRIREKNGLNSVALSGGVFQNIFLLEKAIKALKNQGFDVYVNTIVPCNDGGISLGQAAVGMNYESERKTL